MTVTICIGSSCHLKGSRDIVSRLQTLIAEHGLNEQVTLAGAFCSGNCVQGVVVTIDGEQVHSVSPDNTETFFQNEILPRLAQ
ncbi:MAG: (2Fe-2S) ferredoxin domain-containing protein [Lachnospiraceae bacterium]|nr:(2Fe-2S) ferredoxin domain-containing protein [Lachnospiraceae bacterium]